MSQGISIPYLRNLVRNGWLVLNALWHFRHATQLGKKVRLWGNPVVRNYGKLIIGDRVRVFSDVARTELAVIDGGTLEIGASAFINYGCSIAANELVSIGPNCLIGNYAIITDNNFHCLEPERRTEKPESAPVFLEENVWLGARVIVLPGVRIGCGSMIGAGSVVTKDIPPRSFAAGVPAKVIKQI